MEVKVYTCKKCGGIGGSFIRDGDDYIHGGNENAMKFCERRQRLAKIVGKWSKKRGRKRKK